MRKGKTTVPSVSPGKTLRVLFLLFIFGAIWEEDMCLYVTVHLWWSEDNFWDLCKSNKHSEPSLQLYFFITRKFKLTRVSSGSSFVICRPLAFLSMELYSIAPEPQVLSWELWVITASTSTVSLLLFHTKKIPTSGSVLTRASSPGHSHALPRPPAVLQLLGLPSHADGLLFPSGLWDAAQFYFLPFKGDVPT